MDPHQRVAPPPLSAGGVAGHVRPQTWGYPHPHPHGVMHATPAHVSGHSSNPPHGPAHAFPAPVSHPHTYVQAMPGPPHSHIAYAPSANPRSGPSTPASGGDQAVGGSEVHPVVLSVPASVGHPQAPHPHHVVAVQASRAAPSTIPQSPHGHAPGIATAAVAGPVASPGAHGPAGHPAGLYPHPSAAVTPAVPGGVQTGASGPAVAPVASTGVARKPRKPYTATKTREMWSPEEHERMIEGLRKYKRDWAKVTEYVGSRSAAQVRSHAQKYFDRVARDKTDEWIPQARPKRKSATPYPRKTGNESSTAAATTAPQPMAPVHPISAPHTPNLVHNVVVANAPSTPGTPATPLYGHHYPHHTHQQPHRATAGMTMAVSHPSHYTYQPHPDAVVYGAPMDPNNPSHAPPARTVILQGSSHAPAAAHPNAGYQVAAAPGTQMPGVAASPRPSGLDATAPDPSTPRLGTVQVPNPRDAASPHIAHAHPSQTYVHAYSPHVYPSGFHPLSAAVARPQKADGPHRPQPASVVVMQPPATARCDQAAVPEQPPSTNGKPQTNVPTDHGVQTSPSGAGQPPHVVVQYHHPTFGMASGPPPHAVPAGHYLHPPGAPTPMRGAVYAPYFVASSISYDGAAHAVQQTPDPARSRTMQEPAHVDQSREPASRQDADTQGGARAAVIVSGGPPRDAAQDSIARQDSAGPTHPPPGAPPGAHVLIAADPHVGPNGHPMYGVSMMSPVSQYSPYPHPQAVYVQHPHGPTPAMMSRGPNPVTPSQCASVPSPVGPTDADPHRPGTAERLCPHGNSAAPGACAKCTALQKFGGVLDEIRAPTVDPGSTEKPNCERQDNDREDRANKGRDHDRDGRADRTTGAQRKTVGDEENSKPHRDARQRSAKEPAARAETDAVDAVVVSRKGSEVTGSSSCDPVVLEKSEDRTRRAPRYEVGSDRACSTSNSDETVSSHENRPEGPSRRVPLSSIDESRKDVEERPSTKNARHDRIGKPSRHSRGGHADASDNTASPRLSTARVSNGPAGGAAKEMIRKSTFPDAPEHTRRRHSEVMGSSPESPTLPRFRTSRPSNASQDRSTCSFGSSATLTERVARKRANNSEDLDDGVVTAQSPRKRSRPYSSPDLASSMRSPRLKSHAREGRSTKALNDCVSVKPAPLSKQKEQKEIFDAVHSLQILATTSTPSSSQNSDVDGTAHASADGGSRSAASAKVPPRAVEAVKAMSAAKNSVSAAVRGGAV